MNWHSNGLESIGRGISVWRTRVRGRAELDGLNARELADIGLTRLDAQREVRKPFWRS